MAAFIARHGLTPGGRPMVRRRDEHVLPCAWLLELPEVPKVTPICGRCGGMEVLVRRWAHRIMLGAIWFDVGVFLVALALKSGGVCW